jgi:poly-gamma-glutamate synthesis protein (capsule biosynthesis protein)
MNDEKEVVIMACGDILLGDFYFNIGSGTGSVIRNKGTEKIFLNVRNVLKNNDILFGNLECPISSQTNKSGLHAKEFLASPEVIKELKINGFDFLSVANNHISQHGDLAFQNTIRYLEKESISAVGQIRSGNKHQLLSERIVNGKKIGVLGYSFVQDHFTKLPINYAYYPDIKNVEDEIIRAKLSCDYLIIMIHWGDEFIKYPSQSQIDLAHHLVNLGVDIILGSHSHTFQHIESYRGKVIAYSLGNFVFSMPWKKTKATGILRIAIKDDEFSYSVIPVWIGNDSFPNLCDINSNNQRYIINQLAEATKLFHTEQKYGKAYTRSVKNAFLSYRIATWSSFIFNIYRMPLSILFRLIIEFLMRRLSKFSFKNNQ